MEPHDGTRSGMVGYVEAERVRAVEHRHAIRVVLSTCAEQLGRQFLGRLIHPKIVAWCDLGWVDEEKPVGPVADLPRKLREGRGVAGPLFDRCDGEFVWFGCVVLWGQVEEVGRGRKSDLAERASQTYISQIPIGKRPLNQATMAARM